MSFLRNSFYLLIVALIFHSCKESESVNDQLTAAKDGKYYGGTLRVNEEEYFKSLYPLNITEVTGHRIAEQIYEGLVTFNQQTLAIEPCLAKYWDIDAEGKVYTFHLQTNVYFQDDQCFPGGKGRKMTANDVKYCFDRLCYYNPADNQGYWIFKDVVKGANEYNALTEAKKDDPNGVNGVKVLNDSTIQVELYQPYAVFLSRLGLIFAKIFPKEAVDFYGSELRSAAVGTGPFMFKKFKENEVVFLKKNPNYWGKDSAGNQLPYLNNVKITFIKEKRAELLAFRKGDIDFIYRLPFDMMDEILDPDGKLKPLYKGIVLQGMNVMSLQYYGFLHPNPAFKDKRVRQAFCYAIDREKLCRYTLRGSGFPAIYGYIPPGTGTYPAQKIKGYTYQPDLARKLLSDAGFPKGKGFPQITLQLNSGGGRNGQVAEAIQKMLIETLNIDVQILTMPWPQHTEAIESAKAPFYRLGWVADYPDGENFLNLFHSKYVPSDINVKTYINSFRYVNKEYDKYFDEAVKTVDEDKRNELYGKADQIAVDDAVVLPIYYDKDYRLLHPNLINFPQNAMEYRNYRDVYFVPKKK
jgi:peptide/nickel transport system substrate-binding protein